MGINESALMSSGRDDWETPQDLFDALHREFHFTLDAAANEWNAKTDIYYDEKIDGLQQPWYGAVWVNPPYGKVIGFWVEKAYREVRTGDADVVVMLLPARTDTSYFHNFVMNSSEVRFIRGRIKFVGAPASAPFPSMIVVFDSLSGIFAPDFYSANKLGKIVRRYVSQEQI